MEGVSLGEADESNDDMLMTEPRVGHLVYQVLCAIPKLSHQKFSKARHVALVVTESSV